MVIERADSPGNAPGGPRNLGQLGMTEAMPHDERRVAIAPDTCLGRLLFDQLNARTHNASGIQRD